MLTSDLGATTVYTTCRRLPFRCVRCCSLRSTLAVLYSRCALYSLCAALRPPLSMLSVCPLCLPWLMPVCAAKPARNMLWYLPCDQHVICVHYRGRSSAPRPLSASSPCWPCHCNYLLALFALSLPSQLYGALFCCAVTQPHSCRRPDSTPTVPISERPVWPFALLPVPSPRQAQASHQPRREAPHTNYHWCTFTDAGVEPAL